MPNVNKNLSSQAHAASQLNVKPTTKANTSKLKNNQKTSPTKDREIPLSEIGILLTDGIKEFHLEGIHDKDDWYKLKIETLSPECLAYLTDKVFSKYFTEMNEGVTRLANENILLKEKLLNEASPFTFCFNFGNSMKTVTLKSAITGLEYLYKYSYDFNRFKDAISRCLFQVAKDYDNEFNQKDAIGDLYMLFEFFNDLQQDITED